MKKYRKFSENVQINFTFFERNMRSEKVKEVQDCEDSS